MTELGIKWKVETRKVADLKDWAKNPRKVSAEDFEKFKESIQKRGFHTVLKIDTDNTIISGHLGRRALQELGVAEVKVLVPERALTEQERDIIGVESNLHRGKFDFEVLANEFEEVDLVSAGLDATAMFGEEEPEPLEDGGCARCEELRKMVRGHEKHSQHKVFEEGKQEEAPRF